MTNECYRKYKKILQKEACERYDNLSEEEKKTRKKAHERYQNFTKEEKEKKHHYYCERNKNLSEEQNQKVVEYIRNHYLAHKKSYLVT